MNVIIIITIVIAGVVLYDFFSTKAIIIRKLRKASYSKIENFKEGALAKIIGEIETIGTPMIAPLSGRKCAYYEIRVEKNQGSGKNSSWKTVIEENKHITFIIRDENHIAYINDTHIKSHIVKDFTFKSSIWNDLPKELYLFLQKNSIDTHGFLGFKIPFRFSESILEYGEKVSVLGQGSWKQAAELNLPENLGKILTIQATQELYIHLSDDSKTFNMVQAKEVKKKNDMGIRRRGEKRYRK